MGVTLSTHSTLAPVSFASTITGFISFAFTTATLIRVFWSEIADIVNAPTQVKTQLGNLRAALWEERDHLRRARRRRARWIRSRAGSGYGPLEVDQSESLNFRLLIATIQDMCREFKDIERPFLRPETSRQELQGELQAAYSSTSRRRRYQEKDLELADDFYSSEYREIAFWQRVVWTRKAGRVKILADNLAKLQLRRYAAQLDEVEYMLRDVYRNGDILDGIDETVYNMNARLSRYVGEKRPQ